MQTKKLLPIFLISFVYLPCIVAQKSSVNNTVKKQLDVAETKMFSGIVSPGNEYFKKYVSDDYITINADGVMANKSETMADSARRKMFQGITTKTFDRTIRVYGNVGIINGRAQFFYQGTMVSEVYYTEIWKNEKGKWLFAGWQGTLTKDSPKAPGS